MGALAVDSVRLKLQEHVATMPFELEPALARPCIDGGMEGYQLCIVVVLLPGTTIYF